MPALHLGIMVTLLILAQDMGWIYATFPKGNLCSALRQIRRGQKAFPIFIDSQFPSAQNDSRPKWQILRWHILDSFITYIYRYYVFIIWNSFFFLLKILFIYFKERQRAQARGRVRGRNRLPTEQRAQHGARSQDPEIVTWTKGRSLTDWATQVPLFHILIKKGLLLIKHDKGP